MGDLSKPSPTIKGIIPESGKEQPNVKRRARPLRFIVKKKGVFDLCSICGTENVEVEECPVCGFLVCNDCRDLSGARIYGVKGISVSITHPRDGHFISSTSYIISNFFISMQSMLIPFLFPIISIYCLK